MRVRASCVLSFLVLAVFLCGTLRAGEPASEPSAPLGSGDGRIHVIPALSRPSVKNGEKLGITAVVKAAAGIRQVEADLGGVETVVLRAAPAQQGGAGPGSRVGLFHAEWTAHGLREQAYPVTLRVTDATGHVFEDRSLSFSDPVAGIATPGTTAYPDGGLRRLHALTFPDESRFSSSVIDPTAGHAYFGTFGYPARVLKVALGTGNAPPVRIGSVTLDELEGDLRSAVIDPAAGYAYFGTGTTPGRVVKVALGAGKSPPTRVGTLVLTDPSEVLLFSAVIDPAAGYAYFGANQTVVKVALGAGNALPTRVGAAPLLAGEQGLTTAAIDVASGYAYFGTGTSPGRVVKVALGGSGPPSRAGGVTLAAGEDSLSGAALDPILQTLHVGTLTVPARVVKLALGGSGDPVRIGALTLDPGEDRITSAVFDPTAARAYFATDTAPPRVVAVALGAGLPTRMAATTLAPEDWILWTAVIDVSGGTAYFGSAGHPGRVVKVALPIGPTMARVGSLDLSSDGSTTAAGVLDPVRGYAYLGFWTSRVVKVALGTGNALPRRVGHVDFDPGQSPSHSAVIDVAAGYAYFGHNAGTVGLLTKVALGEGDDPPIRVGTLSLPGEYNLNYGTIDPASGTAYFVAAVQHKVVKVALGAGNAPPTRIGAATFAADETVLAPMVIDPASGYGFVGSHNPIDKVVKFSLGSGQDPPARVGALTLEPNEVNLQCAFLHEGYAYFGTYGPTTGPGRIVKVDPGAGNAPPTRVGSIALEPGEERITRAALDPACGVAYFIFYTQPQSGRVVRVSLKGALPRRLDALTLAPGENSQLWYLLADNAAGHLYLALNGDRLLKVSVAPACSAPVRSGALVLDLRPPFSCAAIDPTSGYAYFGTDSRPGRVTKVALGDGSAAPTVAGELVLNANEGLMDGAVLDPSSGTGFFGCYPGRVVKVALGAGGAPPTRIGAATLDVNQETYFTSAVIDPASGYAYFGTLNQHPRIVKVALGGPGSPPTRVGALALEARYGALHSAAIDLVSGRAFFGSSSGEVVKVALGAGNAPPTRIGQPVFLGAGVLASAAIDSFAGYAYFGTWTSPGAIWKVRLGAPNEPPVRIGVVSLSNEKYLGVAAMDRLSGRALFTSSMSPGRLAKVNLGSGSLLPNRVGGIAVASGESFPVSSVADLGKGLAVLGCQSTLVGVGFSQNGQVKATRMTMPETGNVTDVQLYSHVAGGQVRMAIYDDATTRTLLWQSGAIANTASNGWLAASIASGTPTSLTLNPGTYWLAWQVDTNADTPSFTAGTAGQGFLFRQAFGPFPAGLTTAQVTSTSERWSQFLTYTVPGFAPPRIEVHPQSRVVGSGAPAAFTVVASGSGPLSYRWRKGGVPLATIDAPIVAIPSAGIGDAGTYDVVVSGPSGSVTSNGATLTVTAPSQGVVPWASPGLAPASPGPIGNAPAAPIPDPGRAALMPTVAPGLLSQAFGAGCPGTGGRVPEIGLAEPTAPERDRFSVQLLSARAGAPALLLVSLGLSPTPLDGGCTLYAQTPFAMLPATTDAEGRAATSFPPLPATPGLAGVSAFFQWTVSDPEGSYAGALAFSDALWVALAP